MQIGIDANEANLPNFRVGINQYAFGLLHALHDLKSSHHFTIYLKAPPQPDLPSENDHWHYRIIPFPKLWTQTRLPFDLFFHSPRPDVFLSLTHYSPRFSPIPTVVTVMDLGFLKFPEQFTAKDINQLKIWTEYSVKKASQIITISKHSKQDIENFYHRPSSDITVTYPGYDKDFFHPTKDESILKKYGIPEKYFLFLSSLKPSKNIENLIRAFSKFPNHDFSLVIAGKKGWLYDQIFALVKNLQLENKVIFTGFLPDSDVPKLMSMSQAFVLPSFYEGFGIPVLEAMACGVPVVISQVASLPEVAGEAGVYVDPYSVDSILGGLVTSVSKSRSKFVQLGLNRVKLFDWRRVAIQTLSVLESLK